MFEKAEERFSVDKGHSYMIGDKLLDVEAGNRYGVCSILVGTGYAQEIMKELIQKGERGSFAFYASDLKEAARWILNRESQTTEGDK